MVISIDIPNAKVAKVLLGLGYGQEAIDAMSPSDANKAIKQVLRGYMLSRYMELKQAELTLDTTAITTDLNIT